MSADDLIRARKAIAIGVGQTTRRNRILADAGILPAIPSRSGKGLPLTLRVTTSTPACLLSNWTWPFGYKQKWPSPGTLVSSDGVWRMAKAAQKNIALRRGTGIDTQDILINFASPTAGPEPLSGSYIHINETAYSDRQWHPIKMVWFYYPGFIGIAQRLKSIDLQQGSYRFKWTFANDDDSTSSYATPICLNRSATEVGLGNREFSYTLSPDTSYERYRRLKSITLAIGASQGKVVFHQSVDANVGILPALENPEVTFFTQPEYSGQTNILNATDLSRMTIIGQPYHGKCIRYSITRAGYASWAPARSQLPYSGKTRYFKSPYAPGPPEESALPSGFTSAGLQLLDDVVLANGTCYAATTTNSLVDTNQWLHVDDAGIVRKLGVVKTAITASTTTYEIHNYGVMSVTWETDVLLGTVTITTTDTYANGLTRDSKHIDTYTGGPDYQTWTAQWGSTPQAGGTRDQTGYPDSSWLNIRLNDTITLEASPDGRQIALMRGFFGMHDKYTFWNTDRYSQSIFPSVILTVATVNISSSLVVSAPTDVFQWQYHYPTNFSATAVAGSWSVYASLGTWWHSYYFHSVRSSGDAYTLRECVGFSYKKDGTLQLAIVEHDYGPTSVLGLTPTEQVLIDSGIPSTDSAPTSGPYANGQTVSVSSYTINGGFGWRQNAARASDFPYPPNRNDYWLISAWRVTNNLIWYQNSYRNPGTYTFTLADNKMVGTEGRDNMSAIFPTATSYDKWASYDPRSGSIFGSNNNLGPVTWI